MKIFIIEDETLPANFLVRKLQKLNKDAEIMGMARTISDAAEFLSSNSPDIVFADIRIADGLSFEVFSRVRTEAAVVFTTSYNEYAIKAFEYNCIDYLLKPVTEEGLSRAFAKYDKYHGSLSLSHLQTAISQMGSGNPVWRKRLLMERGTSVSVVPMEAVACMTIEFSCVTVHLQDGTSGLVDMRLDELEEQLDPEKFIRVSRQCIVSLDSIADIIHMPAGRLMLILHTPDRKQVIVTRSRVSALKEKLDR